MNSSRYVFDLKKKKTYYRTIPRDEGRDRSLGAGGVYIRDGNSSKDMIVQTTPRCAVNFHVTFSPSMLTCREIITMRARWDLITPSILLSLVQQPPDQHQ